MQAKLWLFLGAEMTMMAMVKVQCNLYPAVRDVPKIEACVGVFSAILKSKSFLLLLTYSFPHRLSWDCHAFLLVPSWGGMRDKPKNVCVEGLGSWVFFCWGCATGLSEPLPHYSLYSVFGILWTIILVTFEQMYVIFAIPA